MSEPSPSSITIYQLRDAIGDLDELREAVDRVKAYQDFQPGKFDRRKLNRQLLALAQDREVRR
jgi:hypothetical protein